MKAHYNQKRVLHALSLRDWRTVAEIQHRLEPPPLSFPAIRKHLLSLEEQGRLVWRSVQPIGREYIKTEKGV